MENTEKLSLEQIRGLLQASQEVRFEATRRQEMYEWVTRTLCYQEYWKQKRAIKGLLRQYTATMTGLSRAQVTRLIARYLEDGQVQERSYRRNQFARHYTGADIELLGTVDEAHGTAQRPSDTEDSVPRVSSIRRSTVRAAGSDLGAAHLQSAQKPSLPEEENRLSEDATGANSHWRAVRKASLDICGLIPFIKVIWMASRTSEVQPHDAGRSPGAEYRRRAVAWHVRPGGLEQRASGSAAADPGRAGRGGPRGPLRAPAEDRSRPGLRRPAGSHRRPSRRGHTHREPGRRRARRRQGQHGPRQLEMKCSINAGADERT